MCMESINYPIGDPPCGNDPSENSSREFLSIDEKSSHQEYNKS